jgi:hypothetical protein
MRPVTQLGWLVMVQLPHEHDPLPDGSMTLVSVKPAGQLSAFEASNATSVHPWGAASEQAVAHVAPVSVCPCASEPPPVSAEVPASWPPRPPSW